MNCMTNQIVEKNNQKAQKPLQKVHATGFICTFCIETNVRLLKILRQANQYVTNILSQLLLISDSIKFHKAANLRLNNVKVYKTFSTSSNFTNKCTIYLNGPIITNVLVFIHLFYQTKLPCNAKKLSPIT